MKFNPVINLQIAPLFAEKTTQAFDKNKPSKNGFLKI